MKKMLALKKLTLLIMVALAVVSCRKHKADDPLADTGRTQRTENLLANLKRMAADGYMFGHQDSPMYGIGWVGDSARSDVRNVCNDFPAVMGFDLGHIELGDSVNLDSVPFSRMRQQIISQYDRGGMVTLSWHLDNPLTGGTSWVKPDSLTAQEKMTVASVLDGGNMHAKMISWIDSVAVFLNSLVTPYGVKVPVVFRPWHEHTGSWFWWGQELCSAEQYKALWQMTADRLKEQGVTNALFAYSPGAVGTADSKAYMERYPGDELIDVLGLDIYCAAEEGDTAALGTFSRDLDSWLGVVCADAKKHGKAAAVTETGYKGIPMDDWWTAVLAPSLNKHSVSYVLVWRNSHTEPGHYFAPYPGQRSAGDFVKFYNDKRSLFLHDVQGLYLKREEPKKSE